MALTPTKPTTPTSPLTLTAAENAALAQLIGLLPHYYQGAVKKRAFGITVTSARPVRIPWTVGHIASVFIPSLAVWMGGDQGLQVGAGGSAGLPIVANAQVIFGPEEGDSDTFLIAQLPSVDVRCLELLPKSG